MSLSNDLDKQLADLQAREHALRQLVASAGWREVIAQADGAITTRRQGSFGLMTSIKGMDDIFGLARMGGEIGGIQFVLQLPHIMLRDLEADIKRVLVEIRETSDGTT